MVYIPMAIHNRLAIRQTPWWLQIAIDRGKKNTAERKKQWTLASVVRYACLHECIMSVMCPLDYIYIYIYIYLGKFHHDLTVLPHWKSWLIREIIHKWP